jgi:hypothetical protein
VPTLVHPDRWRIAGCPVNGPALASRGADVVCVWFTTSATGAHVRAAFSRDGGRSFSPALEIGGSRPLGRVDVVVLDDGAALASWLEEKDGDAVIAVRRVDPSGAMDPVREVVVTRGTRSSGMPRLARAGEHVMLAWTDPDPSSRGRTALLTGIR